MPAQSASILAWRDELGALEARLGGLFGRPEPRRQAGLYLEGLLSATKRKNGWQLAERIGDARPWRTQRVPSHALWARTRHETCAVTTPSSISARRMGCSSWTRPGS